MHLLLFLRTLKEPHHVKDMYLGREGLINPGKQVSWNNPVGWMNYIRITEWFLLEETLKIIQLQPSAMARITFHKTRLLKAPSSLALGLFQRWGICKFSEPPVPSSDHPHSKVFVFNAQSKSTLKIPYVDLLFETLCLITILIDRTAPPHLSCRPLLDTEKLL